jgi:predicted membrane protein DUF2207
MPASPYLLLVPLLLLAYYAGVRLWLRRDIETDAVVVQYGPPDDLSPAELRLADCGCTDATSIAAMIAQLGHKGALSAARQPNGSFLLIRKVPLNDPMLSAEELAVFRKVFDHYLGTPAPNEGSLGIMGINDVPDPIAPPLRSTVLAPSLAEVSAKRMSATTAALHELAAKAIAGKYYRWNFVYVFAGMIITLLFALWSASTIKSREPLFFLTIWYFFFAQMITAMLAMNGSRTKLWPRPPMLAGTIVMWAMVLIFPMLMARKLVAPGATKQIAAFALMIIINSIFVPLLRTPTKAGVLLKQKITGYRQFLESVESDQIDRLSDHGFNPVSNEHLAYAIALGVRQSWGDALERTTATATTSV